MNIIIRDPSSICRLWFLEINRAHYIMSYTTIDDVDVFIYFSVLVNDSNIQNLTVDLCKQSVSLHI